MPKKTSKIMYESDSDSDSESEKQIMKMIKKHSKKHGTGLFDKIKNAFPQVTNYVSDKKGLASDVLHYGLPVASGAAGSSMGGPMGGLAGATAGKVAADEIARSQGMKTGYGVHIDIGSHNASGRRAKTGMGFFTDLADDLRPITTDPRVQRLITAGLNRGSSAIEGSGFFTDLSQDLRPITTDPRVQRLITAGLDRGTRTIEGSGFFTDLANDLRPITTDPRVQRLITAGLDRGTRAIEGSGFFTDLANDLRPITTDDRVQRLITAGLDRGTKALEGSGMKSRKKSKDHVSKRAFDQYIENEMARAARKDVSEARAIRSGVKPKVGGYGHGLVKGSQEMKDKMARIRAMRKK
jgi:hypothetical protein